MAVKTRPMYRVIQNWLEAYSLFELFKWLWEARRQVVCYLVDVSYNDVWRHRLPAWRRVRTLLATQVRGKLLDVIAGWLSFPCN